MDYIQLPATDDARQVMYVPVSPDGHAFQAKVELRYLSAAGQWFLSISDAVTGKELVNQIPLICSHERLNDLLYPFRWQFLGRGIGSLFCLKAVENPSSADPSRDNLNEFRIIWGDQWAEE